jgi:hypothetical protein
VLEERSLPSVVNWTGTAGNFDWDTAANWDSRAVPGATDDVVISQSGITVTHAANVGESINSLSSQANLNWQAGSFTAAGQVVFDGDSASIAGAYQAGSTVELNHAQVSLSGPVTALGATSLDYGCGVHLQPATPQTLTLRYTSGRDHAGNFNESINSLSSQANINWQNGSLALASNSSVSGAFNNAGAITIHGNTLALNGRAPIPAASLSLAAP